MLDKNRKKKQYRFNSDSLSYEQVKPDGRYYAWQIFKYAALCAVIATVSIVSFNTIFESPKVRSVKRELAFKDEQQKDLSQKLDTLEALIADLRYKDDNIYRNIFGADQYPENLRSRGVGGADRYANLRNYSNSEAIIETHKRISKLQRSAVGQSKSYEEVYDLAKTKTQMLSSIPAIQPIDNRDLTRMASGFGRRIHPIYKIPKMHWGMDFTAKTGTNIYASGDGVVQSKVEHPTKGYGNHVWIKHGYGYETHYAHMSKILVNVGDRVKRGQIIGLVGNTGLSNGPHLHYEVKKDGEKVNPAFYFFNDLSPEQFDELLTKASMANQSFD